MHFDLLSIIWLLFLYGQPVRPAQTIQRRFGNVRIRIYESLRMVLLAQCCAQFSGRKNIFRKIIFKPPNGSMGRHGVANQLQVG